MWQESRQCDGGPALWRRRLGSAALACEAQTGSGQDIFEVLAQPMQVGPAQEGVLRWGKERGRRHGVASPGSKHPLRAEALVSPVCREAGIISQASAQHRQQRCP